MTTKDRAPRNHCANHRRSIRMPYAIAVIGPGDVERGAQIVLERIAERGPHLVMVSPNGSVYCILATENKADILAEQFHVWVAGWFSYGYRLGKEVHRTTADDIAGAMETALSQLQQVAA